MVKSRGCGVHGFGLPTCRLVVATSLFLAGSVLAAGCGAKPVADTGQTVQAEPMRLLAKWKTSQEGGPPDRDRAQNELRQRFPAIVGWQSFSYVPHVVVIELKPGADTAMDKKLIQQLLQTGWFHYVEPDTTVHVFPE